MAVTDRGGFTTRRFKTARTVLALMLREMSTTYGRSPGGYIWAILEPIGGITMLTIIMVVGLRIRTPPIGVNFPIFFASGMLPFMMYQQIANPVARAIQFSRPLLFYPGVTYVDAVLARFLLMFLTKVVVFFVVVGMITLLFDTRTSFDLGYIALSMAMAASLGLGVGCMNAYLIPTYPLWDSLWGIVTTPLFFMSTILFLLEDLPEDIRAVLWWNPLVHVVATMRRGFYPTYDGSFASPMYVFLIAAVAIALGLLLLGRFYRDILNR